MGFKLHLRAHTVRSRYRLYRSSVQKVSRQAGILAREANNFRNADPARSTWATVLAGGKYYSENPITQCTAHLSSHPSDFNFTPLDPAYSLLTTSALLPEHEAMLKPSYVVHKSVDPSVAVASTSASQADAEEGGGGGEEEDPDRVITNARPARQGDGLLGPPALVSLFSNLPRATSAYDSGLSRYFAVEKESDFPIFGKLHELDPLRPGFHEPAYTSYTHYWKSVLGERPLPITNHVRFTEFSPMRLHLRSRVRHNKFRGPWSPRSSPQKQTRTWPSTKTSLWERPPPNGHRYQAEVGTEIK